MKKQYFILFYFIFIIFCSHADNDKFGTFLSSEIVPQNIFLQNLGIDDNGNIPTTNFGNSFLDMVCNNIKSNEFLSKYCMQNMHEISTNPIYGMKNEIGNLVNFVNNNVSNSGAVKLNFSMIKYNSPGFNPYLKLMKVSPNLTLSGIVILPEDNNGNLLSYNKIKGIVIYYHPTVISKNSVPSGFGNIDTLSMQKTFYSQNILASIYGSSGYIVIAPDYIGQGFNYNTPHPYIIAPNENALSGIYMLKALKMYLLQNFKYDIRNLTNNNLFISSYSEGATYALKASQLLQNQYSYILSELNIKLKLTLGISGAYDVSNTMVNFTFDNNLTLANNKWGVATGCYNINSEFCNEDSPEYNSLLAQYEVAKSKPMLSAYLMYSIMSYYFESISILYPVFSSSNFFHQYKCTNFNNYIMNMNNQSFTFNCNEIYNNEKNILDLINDKTLSNESISTQLLSNATQGGFFIGTSLLFADFINSQSKPDVPNFTSASYFMNKDMRTNKVGLDIIKQSDTYHWATNSPVTIIYLKHDSVVTNINSQLACDHVNGIIENSQGLINCISINNDNLYDIESIFKLTANLPIYLNHEFSEGISQLVALQQMNNK